MEATAEPTTSIPKSLERKHEQIQKLYEDNKDLAPNEKDLDRLSGIMAKQTGRFEESLIQASMDNLFKIAQGKMESDHDKKVLTGLRAMVRELEETLYRPHARYQDAFFFPNMANVQKLVGYIEKAKKSIDLAIFSFTNDDLANALLAAHARGVALRIITDDEAMKGKGADTQRMADAGVPCRTDSEEQYHMHNKFMVVDNYFLVTGSFNWTFQAGKSNQENVVVLDGQYYIDKYAKEFNKLWAQFAPNKVEADQERAALTIQKNFRRNQDKEKAQRKTRKRQNADGWNMN